MNSTGDFIYNLHTWLPIKNNNCVHGYNFCEGLGKNKTFGESEFWLFRQIPGFDWTLEVEVCDINKV